MQEITNEQLKDPLYFYKTYKADNLALLFPTMTDIGFDCDFAHGTGVVVGFAEPNTKHHYGQWKILISLNQHTTQWKMIDYAFKSHQVLAVPLFRHSSQGFITHYNVVKL